MLRTKEKLAVFYHKPSREVLPKPQEWFGLENVIDIAQNKVRTKELT